MSLKAKKYLCVGLMIALCGAVRFFLEWGIVCIPLLLILGLLIFLKEGNRKLNILNGLLIIIFPLLNVLFINPNLLSNLAYSCLLLLISGVFIISSFDFYQFREMWLKWMKWLCLISIVVQILHDINIISPGGSDIRGCLTTLYFFNCDWGQYRLSSIYWEPGQFQIVLTYTLVMFTDELGRWEKFNLMFRKFGVLFVAFIMTNSTTGYISILLIVVAIFLYSKKTKMSLVKKLLYLIPLSIIILIMINSNTIQEKIVQSQNLDSGSATSTAIRLQDNLALIEVTKDAPFFGFGLDTKEMLERKMYYGSITSSNGWLYASAAFGLVYIILFLYVIYSRVTEMPRSIPSLMILLILFISQCNEYLIFFPYMLPFIYKFKSYKIEKYND